MRPFWAKFGVRAAGSLLAGDIEVVEAEFASVRTRYLIGVLCRLAVITPSVSLRLAWRFGRRWLKFRGWNG